MGQTFADFEVILVEDGSPDNCSAICDEYVKKDNRIVVIHQENAGLSVARNVGIKWAKENSNSEWLSFIDSDDWVHTSFLEKLLSAAKKFNTVVSCCLFQTIREGEKIEKVSESSIHLYLTEDIYCSKSNNGVDAYSWRYLYQKILFEDVYYPEGKLYEDLFTTHRLIFKTNVVPVVEEPLYYYFQRDDSIVHSKWTKGQMDRLEGYEALIRFFRKSEKKHVELCVKRGYIIAIYSNYLQVQESNLCKSKRIIKARLKMKLRGALFRYAKEVGISLKTENYLYAIAYPKMVTIYWHIRGIMKKFK